MDIYSQQYPESGLLNYNYIDILAVFNIFMFTYSFICRYVFVVRQFQNASAHGGEAVLPTDKL